MESGCGLDSFDFVTVTVAVACEHRNGPLDSIKGGEFLDELSDCQVLDIEPVHRTPKLI
jgi:hypothetical protein